MTASTAVTFALGFTLGMPQTFWAVIAALIVTLLLVPQSLAYALLAGLPPVVGVMASLLPILAYAAFGSSSTLAPLARSGSASTIRGNRPSGARATRPGFKPSISACLKRPGSLRCALICIRSGG